MPHAPVQLHPPHFIDPHPSIHAEKIGYLSGKMEEIQQDIRIGNEKVETLIEKMDERLKLLEDDNKALKSYIRMCKLAAGAIIGLFAVPWMAIWNFIKPLSKVAP